jgi:hypothetical protein
MALKLFLKYVLLGFLVLSAAPLAQAQSFCAHVFSGQEVRRSVVPVFTPGAAKYGPVITYLTRYGDAVRKGTSFIIQGKKQSIEAWGRDSAGNDFVVLMDRFGNIHDVLLSELPKRAFVLKQVHLDEVMKYQNELVVDRISTDYPKITPEKAQQAFDAMKKFFFAKFRAFVEGYEQNRSPYMYEELDVIDYSWHAFILMTNLYHDFGRKYFDTFLHHKTQSFQDEESGFIRAVPRDGPVPAIINREHVDRYVRETLGDETFQSWFVKRDFDPNHLAPVAKASLPWEKYSFAERGPFVGKVMDPKKASARLLTKNQAEELGLDTGAGATHFFNFLHEGKKWTASLNASELKSVSLVIQNFKLKTGQERGHTMLRLDLNPGHPVVLHEQTAEGLGKTLSLSEIYLSISAQREENAPVARPGFLEENTAITYMIESRAQLLESNQKRNGTFTEKVLNLNAGEMSDLLKIYLEKSQNEGGQEFFNMNYKGCASTCFAIVKQATSSRPKASALMQWMLKTISFNAKWSMSVFQWSDFVDKPH